METNSLKVTWTISARNDMKLIYFYIAQFSKQSAQKVIDGLFMKSNQLSIKGFSESGAKDEYNPKYRRLIEGNYKILYTITDNEVFINKVFDCRFDPEKLKKL